MAELLDLKDKKLLYHLSINARESHTKLAKKVALSKNAVKYRIERLRQKGIIKNFASVINLGSLNLTTFTVLLRFNKDIYKNNEIVDYFKNHDFADWAITLSGDWDMFVEFACKNLNHFTEIIEGIIEEFGESLNTYEVFHSRNTIKIEHLIEEFHKEAIPEPLPTKERTIEHFKIDKTDKKILSIISKDSGLPYHEIAERLKITSDIVRYRMKNMIKNKVIIKFFPEISLPKLGYTKYLYTLKLKNLSKGKLAKIKSTLHQNKSITYAFIDVNTFAIVFVCAFKSPEEIDTLSRNLRNKFSDVIDHQHYLIIKEEILFNLFPKGLVK